MNQRRRRAAIMPRTISFAFAATLSLAAHDVAVATMADETADASISSPANGTDFGRTVVACDVNGDHLGDAVVASEREQVGSLSNAGRVYAYLSSASGLATAPSSVLSGTQADEHLGYGLICAGDVNADGFEDVVVGSYGSSAGRLFLFLGSSSGLSSTPSVALAAGGGFGSTVTAAGDIDNDGYDDVAVELPSGTGNVYIYRGRAAGLNANPDQTFVGAYPHGIGDVNQDGFDDLAIADSSGNPQYIGIHSGNAAGLATKASTTLAFSGLANFSILNAGDVNADGVPDLVVGCPLEDTVHGVNAGRVYVLFGSASGFAKTNSAVIDGYTPAGHLGWSLSSGFVNADSISDFVISEPGNAGNRFTTARIFYGAIGGPQAGPTLTASDSVTAFGNSVDLSRDINGDESQDLLIGAPCAKCSAGRVFAYLGTSNHSISANPETVSFGKQRLDTTSTAQSISLTNTGNSSLQITGLVIGGNSASDFSIVTDQDRCTSRSLSPSQSCTASVRFTPSAHGQRTASLGIRTSQGASSSVALTGSGSAPVASISPPSLEFGSQLQGTESASKTVTLTNMGDAALNITNFYTTSTDYKVLNGFPASLQPGDSAQVTISFKPAVAGTRSGRFEVVTDASSSPSTVSLAGTGSAPTANGGSTGGGTGTSAGQASGSGGGGGGAFSVNLLMGLLLAALCSGRRPRGQSDLRLCENVR